MVGVAPTREEIMNAANDEILARIRGALGGTTAPPAVREQVPKEYRYHGTLAPAERIELFIDRLHDYDAIVYRAAQHEIAGVIAGILQARGKSGLLVPLGIPNAWLPAGFLFKRDTGLSYDEIDKSEGVLTGCAAAIALTGTMVLRHSEAEGRRALTLVPDYHLCVVCEQQIVETVPEGIAQMSAYAPAPITTISGPSATSDIEMTRIKGVHGPRTLEVILVGSEPRP
jgi:L-lactate dehydrogenase complex protein LldG